MQLKQTPINFTYYKNLKQRSSSNITIYEVTMNKKSKFFLPLLLFFLLIQSLSALETSLLYKEKKFISGKKNLKIIFSTHKGDSFVPPKSVDKSNFLYFTYKPATDWEIKDTDSRDGLNDISITQKSSSISPSSIVPHLENNKITFVVAAFPKNSLEIFSTFRFTNALGSSPNISIPEKYWPQYLKYKGYYEEGSANFDKKKYLLAFKTLKHFISEDQIIKHFTSTEFAKPLLKRTVTSYLKKFEGKFDFLNLELKKSQTANTGQIAEVDSILAGLKIGQQSFQPYFNSSETSEAKEGFDKLIENVQTTFQNLQNKYMEQFAYEDYNVYKFNLFIELCGRLLCYTDKIINLEEMDSISTQILDENSENIYFSEKAIELKELSWESDFHLFINLINKNIQDSQMVFSENIMDNLGSLQDQEKQPYYHIFTGFNKLFGKDNPAFKENLILATRKCTDLKFLSDIGNVLISFGISQSKISDDILSSLNRGLELENEEELDKAQHVFDIITKKTNDFAPPYFFLGRISYLQGQYASSDILFDKSLSIDPNYIAPWRYKIRSYLDNNNFETAQVEIKKALSNNEIWYFYYLESLILFFLDEYEQAEGIALNKCLPINKHSFDLHILLGDIYREKGDLDSAEEQFKKAGKIDIQNSKFNEKLQEISELRNQ